MTRVVKMKTEEGFYTRSIQGLCLLEETERKGNQPKIQDVWSGLECSGEKATWAGFWTRFVSEFRRADTLDRLEAELRNRRQEPNEALSPYFYTMIMLMKKLEMETNESMSIPENLEQ